MWKAVQYERNRYNSTPSAIVEFEADEQYSSQNLNTCEIWGKLDHPNVVKAMNYLTSESEGIALLQTHYADMGEIGTYNTEVGKFEVNDDVKFYLKQKLRNDWNFNTFGRAMCSNLNERAARFVFFGLAEGLEYLHDTAKIAH